MLKFGFATGFHSISFQTRKYNNSLIFQFPDTKLTETIHKLILNIFLKKKLKT